MATTLVIPTSWITSSDLSGGSDINDWLLEKGYTVISRSRDRSFWTVVIEETLNNTQKDALGTLIETEMRPNKDIVFRPRRDRRLAVSVNPIDDEPTRER